MSESHVWETFQDEVLRCMHCSAPKWEHPGYYHLSPTFQRGQRLEILRTRIRSLDVKRDVKDVLLALIEEVA